MSDDVKRWSAAILKDGSLYIGQTSVTLPCDIVEVMSVSDHDRIVAHLLAELETARRVRERLEWITRQYKFHGTDGCKGCETGRVTTFVANEKCISCAPETYENPFDAEIAAIK